MRKRGEDAAQEMLTGPHQWLLRVVSPAFLVNAFPRLFSFYYRGGRLEVEMVDDGHARSVLWAEGMYAEWYAHGLPTWVLTALKVAGASDPTVEYLPPAGEGALAFKHQYEIRWR